MEELTYNKEVIPKHCMNPEWLALAQRPVPRNDIQYARIQTKKNPHISAKAPFSTEQSFFN